MLLTDMQCTKVPSLLHVRVTEARRSSVLCKWRESIIRELAVCLWHSPHSILPLQMLQYGSTYVCDTRIADAPGGKHDENDLWGGTHPGVVARSLLGTHPGLRGGS